MTLFLFQYEFLGNHPAFENNSFINLFIYETVSGECNPP